MELQAQILVRNICYYLHVIDKTKGSGYCSPKKCGISAITPIKAASMMTWNISVCVSPGVSVSSASASSSTSVQAQIDVDEDFVADADLIAASLMGKQCSQHPLSISQIVQVMGYLLFKLKYWITAHWHKFPIN